MGVEHRVDINIFYSRLTNVCFYYFCDVFNVFLTFCYIFERFYMYDWTNE